MQITLEQLKEIAKAGYGWNLPLSDISVSINCNIYMLTDKRDGADILWITIKSNDFIELDSCGYEFNHLAAIRKMEELGLIEK